MPLLRPAPSRHPRALVIATVGFLAVPALVQIGGWLGVFVGLVAAAGAILAVPGILVLSTVRPTRRDDRGPILIASAFGTLMGLASGAGGLGTYTGDWRKHFAILHDLSTHEWPVRYTLATSAGQVDAELNYTLAWYLPAGLVGRATNWLGANIAIGVWFGLGAFLICWWVVELVGTRWAPLILVAFSGWDVVGGWLLPRLSGWATTPVLEEWAHEWQIPSILRGWFEAPQHTVPTMLLMALVIGGVIAELSLAHRIVLAAAAALMSPFAIIAVVPFVVAQRRLLGPSLGSPRELVGAAVMAVGTIAVFAGRLAGPPAGMPNEVTVTSVLVDPRFADAGAANLSAAFIAVVLFDIAVLGVPLLVIANNRVDRQTVLFASGWMVLCLVGRIGHNNDLAMRGVGGALFLFAVMWARALATMPKRRVVLGPLFAIGSLSALIALGHNALTPQEYGNYSSTNIDETAGLIEMQQIWYPERDSLLSQYLVAAD